ncbi:MAG: ATP-binding protein [Leptospiraceae bacterium]|nr:ATP-binding protein [Leptospiraceae bacterium]MDW8307321.1 ATP-binding protein [Leptospiraceae bacterium]
MSHLLPGFAEVLLEQFPSPLFVVDSNYQVLYENHALKEFFTTNKTHELPCYERYYQRSSACPFCPFLKKTPRSLEKGHRLQVSFGERERSRELHLEVFPSFINHGDQSYVVEYVRDITRLVSKEAEFKRNEKLLSLGLVSRLVAHELENPLIGIQLTLQAITQLVQNEKEIIQKLELIERDVERAKLILQDIRNYGEPSSLPREPVKIKKVIDEAINSMKRLAPRRIEPHNVEFRCFWNGQEEVMIYGHELRLHQVFANLIKNSYEAYLRPGRKGKLIFRIFFFRRNQADAQFPSLFDQDILEIRMIDNAGGIPSKVLRRVFDPFFTTKKTRVRGSGLGLLVVQKILEEHNAEIDMESKGHYTTVRLFFEICDA